MAGLKRTARTNGREANEAGEGSPIAAQTRPVRRPTRKPIAVILDDDNNQQVLRGARFGRREFVSSFRSAWAEPDVILAAADGPWAYEASGAWIFTQLLRPSDDRTWAWDQKPRRGSYVTVVRAHSQGPEYRIVNKAGYVREIGGDHEVRSSEFASLVDGRVAWYAWDYALAFRGALTWVGDDASVEAIRAAIRAIEAPKAALRWLRALDATSAYRANTLWSLELFKYDGVTGLLAFNGHTAAVPRYSAEQLPDYDLSGLSGPGVYFILPWEVAGTIHWLLRPSWAVPSDHSALKSFLKRKESIARLAGEPPTPTYTPPASSVTAAESQVATQLAMMRGERREQARRDALEREGAFLIGASLLGAIGLRSGNK